MDNPETLTTLGTLDTFDSLKVTSYLMVFGLWCLVPLNNISVTSWLCFIGGENHRPAASH